jgi:hypothetical protein
MTWTPDTWYHVAATMSGNTGTIKLYVNGIEETLTAPSLANPTAYARLSSTGEANIGRNTGLTGQLYKGALDDLGLWYGAMDPKKIALIHGLGLFSGVDLESASIDHVLAVFNAGSGSAVVGGQTWEYKTGLPSTTVGAIGGSVAGGDAYIVLDTSANGVALPAGGFSVWITGSFANGSVPVDKRGPNDDFDNDGISNLVEYAVAGQDPTVGNAAVGTFNGTTLSFAKRTGTNGLIYAIQESTDLGLTIPWTEVPAGPSYTNDPSTISYTLTPGSPVRNFIRLQVLSN